jgi:predicted transcriptional regulator
MKTLTRHLRMVHNLKPGEYGKQFAIPTKQPLTAKRFSEARRRSALERGLVDVLARARDTRIAKIQAKKSAPVKAVKVKLTKNIKIPF